MNELIETLAKQSEDSFQIDQQLYTKYNVKKGLREITTGKGVLTGLTNIAEVKSYVIDDYEQVPCEGVLYYHGYNIEELINGFSKGGRYGFSETVYLLLFGKLPTSGELSSFSSLLEKLGALPKGFVRDTILHVPSSDVMNSLARSVLTLYSYDHCADDISVHNMIRQSLQLIAQFPTLAIYGYQAYKYYHRNEKICFHSPQPGYSTSQNMLHMLRSDNVFTELEAQVLDVALVLHADHGGGNNSTFTTRVVSSTGTDTYSTIAAAIGSLKGSRHGGANIKVAKMFDELKCKVKNWKNDDEVEEYLTDLLNKKAFDRSGLIYGIGHAVYTLSDPRARIFKEYVKKLSIEKRLEDEFALYESVERLAPVLIAEKCKNGKRVSANVDFYSGFLYRMLEIPQELFTSIFAVARVSGWCAHRIEENISNGRLIRPAHKNVRGRRVYVDMENR